MSGSSSAALGSAAAMSTDAVDLSTSLRPGELEHRTECALACRREGWCPQGGAVPTTRDKEETRICFRGVCTDRQAVGVSHSLYAPMPRRNPACENKGLPQVVVRPSPFLPRLYTSGAFKVPIA